MTNGTPTVVHFVIEKPTKGTIRYKEVVDDAIGKVIGTLYIQKSALGNDVPQALEVTISPK